MASTDYRIVISGVTAAAPSDGFVDPTRPEVRMAANAATAPTTIAQGRAKARANARWERIVQKLHLLGNMYVSNISTPGATASAAATSITFDVSVEAGNATLVTEDELNPGGWVTGTGAIRRAVARALVLASDETVETLDLTKSTAPGASTGSIARVGSRIERITVGSLAANLTAAEALVTVTAI